MLALSTVSGLLLGACSAGARSPAQSGNLVSSKSPTSLPVRHGSAFAIDQLAPNLGAPLVLYTDVTSGPNSGGENNDGAYLSIFGKHFGTKGLGTAVKVFIGGVQVSNYRYLGPSRGRPDIEQISVQVGHLGDPKPGRPLPIMVVSNGRDSNTNHTFTVNPGRMLFVSQRGNDATAIPGDIERPYRYVQGGKNCAFDAARPGDTIVLLGTPLNGKSITSDPTPPSAAWTDQYRGYFLRFIGKDGTAPTGALRTGPISLIAYPDDDVYIYESYASHAKGAITGVDTRSYVGGRYVTIADLRIEAGGPSGVINEQVDSDHWRVVNNDITAATGINDAHNLAAGIDGTGTNSYWVGNHVHDIRSGARSMTMHGIYIGGNGSYDVAYNWIDKVTDGSGFQVYTDEGSSHITNDVSLHHNMIYNVRKYGINIANGSGVGFVVYDNVVYNSGMGCLRFNTDTLHDAKIYNNTFYNCSTTRGYGVVNNDAVLPSDAIDMENNILYATPGGSYSGGSVGMSIGIGLVTHNLFYNGVDDDNWDSHPVSKNPMFVNLVTPNLHLKSGSPAIGSGSTAVSTIVTTDYDLNPRRPNSIGIGAYAY